jgi:hypothetical protein
MTCDQFRDWLDRAVAVLEKLHAQYHAERVPPDHSDGQGIPGLPPEPMGER